ncbi:Hypothetical protein PFR_JS13-2_1164 [Propionibacterium freudenreichii]|uniref:hypothetical protein n=1 Tax=Propionibacterium freudenreichii TaxID=1744 RepID=UPI000BC344BB|nr:hypothetical protein [Propionibacterium freudenreichii]SBN60097.1 Hypothetical protein PFR_JS11_1175 [Propionibacterium freudenreichii]SCQ48553.1 Hypothetical protein PFR_JS13-1_1175 [Propionibacterium freudenreichii]SCQ53633.1 Hypothetical protein PFR_JS13-2_1164 [Propionibacterium freudenreichii]
MSHQRVKRLTQFIAATAIASLITLPAAADGLSLGSRPDQAPRTSQSGNSISVEAWAGGTTATTNTAGTTATEFDSTAWTRWALSPCSTIMKPAANTGALFTPETKKQAATSQGIDCTTPNTTTIATTAHHAIATMTLPDTTIKLDPDPTTNQWHAAAVGQQLWFTLDNPGPQHTTTTNTDITITLTATPGAVTINPGTINPGAHTTPIRCTTGRPRPTTTNGNQPSPVCGTSYQHPGHYTITATRTWTITWTAQGHTGTETITRPATAPTLDVIELHSLLVPNN